MDEIRINDIWVHKESNTLYLIICNAGAEKIDGLWDWTPRVVYQSLQDGNTYIRETSEFLEKFRLNINTGDPHQTT